MQSRNILWPIFDDNDKLLWYDEEVLNSPSNVHRKREHKKDKYNFNNDVKQTTHKKVKDTLNNIDESDLQDKNL